jgi:5-methylcytosine-specific restriction endonuclease McrA
MSNTSISNNVRATRAWATLSRRRLAIARANDEVCCRCGRAIDYDLPSNERTGPTTDHLDPLALGGDLLPRLEDLGPAHRACNSRHGGLLSARLARAGRAPGSPAPRVKRRSEIGNPEEIGTTG